MEKYFYYYNPQLLHVNKITKVKKMMKAVLVVVIAFLATSNASRFNRFRPLGNNNQAVDSSKSMFCGRYDCPAYTVVSSTQVSYSEFVNIVLFFRHFCNCYINRACDTI